MNYYDSFVYNSETVGQQYKQHQQELLNASFRDSPTWTDDIFIEGCLGSLCFDKTEARIVKIVDSKTGERINNDYRKLIFPDISFKPILGSRYKFENNVWIVYSINNTNSIHSSCYVRRCNNTINLQDKYGNIHEEPCAVDLKPTKSGNTDTERMTIPIARQTIEYQVNEWTKPLFINSRIMLNRQVYKIGSIVEMDRTETFNKDSITYAKFYLDDDLKNEYDNEDLQVADFKKYDYKIIVPSSLELKVGAKGKLSGKVLLNEEEINEPLIWKSENPRIISINSKTGEYQAKELGEVHLIASMKNSSLYSENIICSVVEHPKEIVKEYSNEICPQDEYIPLGQTKEYRVYEKYGEDITETQFLITSEGMSNKFYKIDIQQNSFKITNLLQNNKKRLKIICKNLRDNSEIVLYIRMGGLF